MKGLLAFVGAVALFPAIALALAFMLYGSGSDGAFGPHALTETSTDGARILFRQPNHARILVDLTTGAAVPYEGPADGWRPPPACPISQGESCVMPNGVFQMGNGFFLGRTDAGEWKALYYPLRNVNPRAMYAIGDKLLIESTGFISTLECVEARSGRSLWTYFFRRSYNESGPYAASVPGRVYDEAFEPAQSQARGTLGVNVAPSPSDIEPYAGKVVFDPVAATANAASARTVRMGVTSWLIVGGIVMLSWRSHRALATILCLAVEGVLLLTFGYIDTRLLIAFAGAMLGTAAAAWVVSGRRGQRWIKIIVFVTVVLWYLPSVLRSVVRT